MNKFVVGLKGGQGNTIALFLLERALKRRFEVRIRMLHFDNNFKQLILLPLFHSPMNKL